jgi:hypothetical protein
LHNFTELVQMIQKIAIDAFEASNPSRVLFGIVTKEDPLEITVEQKLPLTMKQLILSRNVTNYKTQISFDNSSIVHDVDGYLPGTTHSISKLSFTNKVKNDITIYNKLKIGEEVILIQMQDGQKYIVWDRVIK